MGQHLTNIARRSSECSPDTFDPSPLVQIPAILIQSNRAHSRVCTIYSVSAEMLKLWVKDLLSYTDTILRIISNRLNVPAACLTQLLTVTTKMFHKPTAQQPTNPIALVILEILGDGLKLKARIMPFTLKSMIEVRNFEVNSFLLI